MDGPGVADARSRFFGPVTLFGKRAADPTWDFLNALQDTVGDAAWRQNAGARYAINAFDLGRPHLMMITFEGVDNISFDVEIVRHWEIVPGEESPLEVASALLSYNYASPLDLVRRFPIGELVGNPFAPLSMSTTYTAWSLDPVILAQSNALQILSKLDNSPKEERIKGLFGDAVKWLLKNVGVKALDWLHGKAHDFISQKVKGHTDYRLAIEADNDRDECEDDYEIASNDHRLTGIEKNPGPVTQTLNGSSNEIPSDEDDKPPDPPDLLGNVDP